MDNLNYQKYLKYKNKYLSLRKFNEQNGGVSVTSIYTVKATVNGEEKQVKFGTLYDGRRKPTKTKFVKVGRVPYIKIDSKEYEIIKAFGEKDPSTILSIIKSQDISNLKSVIVHEKPCLTYNSIEYRSYGSAPVCQKKRGKITYEFTNVKII